MLFGKVINYRLLAFYRHYAFQAQSEHHTRLDSSLSMRAAWSGFQVACMPIACMCERWQHSWCLGQLHGTHGMFCLLQLMLQACAHPMKHRTGLRPCPCIGIMASWCTPNTCSPSFAAVATCLLGSHDPHHLYDNDPTVMTNDPASPVTTV